jgi:Rrf2 family protein
MFSRATEYAVRALAYLACQAPGKLSGAREIAEAEQIPMAFLWKILRVLTRRRIIRSFKGVRGGYELAKSPQKIALQEIISAIERSPGKTPYAAGLGSCGRADRCAFHSTWAEMNQQLERLLKETTVADLAACSAAGGRPAHNGS